MSKGVYSVLFSGVITVAKTLIQIKAGAITPLEILRASITNISVDASDSGSAIISRKSAAATVTSYTPLLWDGSSGAADAAGGTAATGHTATVEGTDGDVLVDEGFNVLNGWLWLPTPEERIIVPGAGFIALRTATTITSATLKGVLVFRELA